MTLDELNATLNGDKVKIEDEAEHFENFLKETPLNKGEVEIDTKDRIINQIRTGKLKPNNSRCEHGVIDCPLPHGDYLEADSHWWWLGMLGLIVGLPLLLGYLVGGVK